MGESLPVRSLPPVKGQGCLTCRNERIRCDKRKPVCYRCRSNSRKCRWGPSTSRAYPLPSKGRPVENIVTDARLLLPRQNPRELAVDQFISIIAPTFAGPFDTEFWSREIPRFCLLDDAVFHAVMALSALCRDYKFDRAEPEEPNVFALQQANLAIQQLTQPHSNPTESQWRVLTTCILFICISLVDRRFEQARLHFKHGFKIYQQLEAAGKRGQKVSLGNAVLAGFQVRDRSLLEIGDAAERTAPKPPGNTKSSLSLSYQGLNPDSIPQEGLAIENLRLAMCASESLMFELVLFTYKHAEDLKSLFLSGRVQLPSITRKQRPYTACYSELQRTMTAFEHWVSSSSDEANWGPVVRHQIRKGLKYIRIYQLANSLLLNTDPDTPNPVSRLRKLPKLCSTIVDLLEEVLDMEAHGYGRGNGEYILPRLGLTNPIRTLVQFGFGYDTRKRAISLLRRPRLEGFWDTLMSASILEAILEREMEGLKLDQSRPDAQERIPILKDTGVEEVDNGTYPLYRVFVTSFKFLGERSAIASLRLWQEYIDGVSGQEKIITW
ncbi:unnamed protein product [Clonostachys chloroleuca]|uniref:Zn(2)-C6 fungal-type domain-containing protein n=1 Tax=Clonostachys chloroleuca TaxID=1926264 RepID=A0AA35VQ00_9HYPO|nr:unnamed protein product [Clonostachys chloroleuca]